LTRDGVFSSASSGGRADAAPFDRLRVAESADVVAISPAFSVVVVIEVSSSASIASSGLTSTALLLRLAVPRRPLGILKVV